MLLSNVWQAIKWIALVSVLVHLFLFAVHYGRYFSIQSHQVISLLPTSTSVLTSTPLPDYHKPSTKTTGKEDIHLETILADTLGSTDYEIDLDNRYHNYNLTRPPLFYMTNDSTQYFIQIGNLTCLTEGTDITLTKTLKASCSCKPNWFGKWCSFPQVIKYSSLKYLRGGNLTVRHEPRRLISAMPFNIEFELLESRLADLGDIIDVFLICESEYSGHGERKPLRLFDKLKKGYLKEWQHKIVYVYLNNFPEKAYGNGWIADDLPRDHLGLQGMKNQVRGVRHDDLFLLFDTDEIPCREVVLFLKVHDGYPEPFGFVLWKTTYGFFWRGGTGEWPMMGGSTVGMLGHVFEYKASKLRNPAGHLPQLGINLKAYISAGANVRMWKLGSKNHFAGWHCSWCFNPEGIRIKLISAINADFPRWGDYPEKQKLGYIMDLIKKGMWFDDKSSMESVVRTYNMYAPPHILKHWQKYKYLLENPYR